MNLVETLAAKVSAPAQDRAPRRTAIPRRKGAQAKPKQADVSSEKERRRSTPPHQTSKQAHLPLAGEVVLKVEAHRLPSEAVVKGQEEVVVPDRRFRTAPLGFRTEQEDSPSQQPTSLAGWSAGESGPVGLGVRAWVLTVEAGGLRSQPTSLELFHPLGLHSAAGQLSVGLIKGPAACHPAGAALLKAGLHSLMPPKRSACPAGQRPGASACKLPSPWPPPTARPAPQWWSWSGGRMGPPSRG